MVKRTTVAASLGLMVSALPDGSIAPEISLCPLGHSGIRAGSLQPNAESLSSETSRSKSTSRASASASSPRLQARSRSSNACWRCRRSSAAPTPYRTPDDMRVTASISAPRRTASCTSPIAFARRAGRRRPPRRRTNGRRRPRLQRDAGAGALPRRLRRTNQHRVGRLGRRRSRLPDVARRRRRARRNARAVGIPRRCRRARQGARLDDRTRAPGAAIGWK